MQYMRPAVAITFSVWPYVENVCPPLSYVMAIVTKSALRWRSNASLSLMLLFSQYKTTWLSAQQSLSRCITCQDV